MLYVRAFRLLFWTNSNHRSASIDRSNLDGSNHKKLITNNIFLPLAITVDEVNEKLYWTDDERGIYFTIQRCDLDGNHRESILRRTNQEPFGIAVANNAIYWTDTIQKKIWTFSLNALESNYSKYKSEPELFYRFNKSTPYGLVAFREKHFECTSELQVPTSKTQYIIEEFSPKIKNESYCLNLGEKVGNHCRCTKGFTGDRCEISVCHNFCLNGGKCITDSAGYAECLCLPGYLGNRCERDVCSGFCLNGGRCFINNSAPLCSCGMRFLGQRCETSLDFICGQICTNSLENAICNCNSTPSKYEEFMDFTKSQDSSHCRQQRIITIFLLSFEILTMLVVVALARKVCILRRRPRIKKRIIVNKGVKSQTPMTARPQTGPSEQCEITIENCCNMNICETVSDIVRVSTYFM